MPKLVGMTESTLQWTNDILGPGFMAADLPLGADPDGEGDVHATLIRYNPDNEDLSDRVAMIWVHGMTDYFFHKHVAEHFHNKGYAFYGIDLRKCGRSHEPHQKWHYISDMHFYEKDLNAALDALPQRKVIMVAHSTAGIIVPLWLDALRRTDPARHERIAALVLNSPWLDMMGIPPLAFKAAKPLFYFFGKVTPHIALHGGNLTAFGDSIHASRYGEWDYNLEKKPLGGHKKYIGWARAVFKGFDIIHSGRVDVGVPILTLTSTKSMFSAPYSEELNYADAVIDVKQSQKWAKELGSHYTLRPLKGARHDVFLSREPIRNEAFRAVDEWLPTVL
ncbi:alpha/beta hydrolase [Corynebacterium striatum]|nr:alpha/beta hydrolase [Corynebacterium striatum]